MDPVRTRQGERHVSPVVAELDRREVADLAWRRRPLVQLTW